jgi:glycosyltransferase involved in cell wall biosynthesis
VTDPATDPVKGGALRILVYPHAMNVGGSQLNAIELAAAVRDLGHKVSVIGEDGPLVEYVHRLGLEHLPLAADRRRPWPATATHLRHLIRERGLDIVHGYEWPPAIEAAAATFPGNRAAAVCTIMSMAVAPFLPAYLPLVVGTRVLQQRTAARRRGPVHLIEPPVDVVDNAPGHPVEEFRAGFELPADDSTLDIVVVGRLVRELKLEGVLTAIDVIGKLARERPVRLIVVGDGEARDQVEERAAKANAHAGRRAVVLTGQLLDPRPAYAAADIMLGMGSSALRALAFGRPLIVQGERGFWQLLTPDSCATFLQQGWYGVGVGDGDGDVSDGSQRLAAILRPLLDNAPLRERLGRYGRELVVERFSLQRAARLQEEIYQQAVAERRAHGTLAQGLAGSRTIAGVVAHKVRGRYQRVRGTEPREDFNVVTLAANSLPPPDGPA